MFVFQKIWRALFSCNTRFEIQYFALLLTKLCLWRWLKAQSCWELDSIRIINIKNTFPQRYMGQNIQEWTKRNLWKTVLKKFEVIWSASRSLHFKFFKGGLSQISLRPFLNTVSDMKFRRFLLETAEAGWISNFQVKFLSLWYTWRKKKILKTIVSYITRPGYYYYAWYCVWILFKLGTISNKYREVFLLNILQEWQSLLNHRLNLKYWFHQIRTEVI